jgi:hypothetical protein
LTFHANCNLATTTALPTCTYNNGTSGVGATLTATANGLLTVDSVSAVLGYRILVKNQASQVQNGIYTVSQVGSGSLPFELTRATDYNTPGTTYLNVDAGDFTLILAGTVNAGTSWVQTVLQPITIGTTGLNFVQFGSGTVLYSASTGLNLSGTNEFSIKNTGVSSATYGSASAVPQIGVNAQGQITSASNTNIAISGSQVTSGSVAIAQGGTGQTAQAAGFNALSPITTLGDLIVGTGTNTAARLGIGSKDQVLTVSGGTAVWAPPSGGGTPGGNPTQFQYNKGGIFGGLPNLTTDGTDTQLNNSSSLKFSNVTTNYVAFKAPTTIGSNVTWTLPNTDGAPNQVLITNGSGVLSWATATLTPTAPTNVSVPTLFGGTATVGQTLQSTTGTWNGYPTPTYGYQWVRGAATNVGTNSPSYQLVDADLGSTIKCTVTATNSAGSAIATSAPTANIAAGPPQAPTGVTASPQDSSAQVSFSAPAITGGSPITSYTVTSNPGGFTASGASSPLTVTGLTNGTSYTFTVTATNAIGTSPASTASSPVTPSSGFSAEYLVVAGGGGGGWEVGGGGGAGGLLNSTLTAAIGTAYTVTVGAGGAGATSRPGGSGGFASVFSAISATGGGKGGNNDSDQTNGGSGGGAGEGASTTPGIAGQGTAGGAADDISGASGGGGGAGFQGGNGGGSGGVGGNGASSSITGTPTTYAGGGGGGRFGGGGSAGGSGGGGTGAIAAGAGGAGTANTGGGGGGSSSTNFAPIQRYPGGAGGSGVVIIKIPDTRTATFSAGVTSSLSTAVSGFKVYTVTQTTTTSETVTFS